MMKKSFIQLLRVALSLWWLGVVASVFVVLSEASVREWLMSFFDDFSVSSGFNVVWYFVVFPIVSAVTLAFVVALALNAIGWIFDLFRRGE